MDDGLRVNSPAQTVSHFVIDPVRLDVDVT